MFQAVTYYNKPVQKQMVDRGKTYVPTSDSHHLNGRTGG